MWLCGNYNYNAFTEEMVPKLDESLFLNADFSGIFSIQSKWNSLFSQVLESSGFEGATVYPKISVLAKKKYYEEILVYPFFIQPRLEFWFCSNPGYNGLPNG